MDRDYKNYFYIADYIKAISRFRIISAEEYLLIYASNARATVSMWDTILREQRT